MKTIILKTVFLLVLTGGASGVVAAPFVHTEFAAETSITVLGDKPLSGGTVFVKRCDQCPRVAVSFNAGTLYYQQRKRISVDAAMALDGQGATIFYDPKTKYVTRVVFWRSQ